MTIRQAQALIAILAFFVGLAFGFGMRTTSCPSVRVAEWVKEGRDFRLVEDERPSFYMDGVCVVSEMGK